MKKICIEHDHNNNLVKKNRMATNGDTTCRDGIAIFTMIFVAIISMFGTIIYSHGNSVHMSDNTWHLVQDEELIVMNDGYI